MCSWFQTRQYSVNTRKNSSNKSLSVISFSLTLPCSSNKHERWEKNYNNMRYVSSISYNKEVHRVHLLGTSICRRSATSICRRNSQKSSQSQLHFQSLFISTSTIEQEVQNWSSNQKSFAGRGLNKNKNCTDLKLEFELRVSLLCMIISCEHSIKQVWCHQMQ